jgi:hypothetical protein
MRKCRTSRLSYDAGSATQEPVFFDEVGDRRPFPAGQPAGQSHQQQLTGRGVDHEAELIPRHPAGRRPEDAGRVLGQNGREPD